MKAIQFQRPGGPHVLEYLDVPTPVPKRNEVLVRAVAIGVSMPEVLVRRGDYAWMPPLPAIPGIEMSGVVVERGVEARGLSVGQAVYVSARELRHRGGCYAEFIAVPERAVSVLPHNVDHHAAAALSGYQVAWHLLNTATRGFTYNSVLVAGAAGGVGSAILQLACAAGKRTIALVGSEEKIAFARLQGASFAFNYRTEGLAKRIAEATEGHGVDLVLDPVGGPRFHERFQNLGNLGMVVLYGYLKGWPDTDLIALMRGLSGKSPALRVFSMHALDDAPDARRDATARLLEMLEKRTIRPAIYARLPLSEAALAHAMLESGVVMGKLLLDP